MSRARRSRPHRLTCTRRGAEHPLLAVRSPEAADPARSRLRSVPRRRPRPQAPPATGRSRETDPARSVSATSTSHGSTSTARALIFISSPSVSISSSTLRSLVVATTRSSRIVAARSARPARARGSSTSSTRSLVGSASSSFTTLERAGGAEHPRQIGKPREHDLQRARARARQARHERLRQRATGGDRRDQIAQAVGPRLLHRAHGTCAALAAKTRAGASRRATAGTSAMSGVPRHATTARRTRPIPSSDRRAPELRGRETRRRPAVSHSCCRSRRGRGRRHAPSRGVRPVSAPTTK